MKLLSALMNWIISFELLILLGLIIRGVTAAAEDRLFLGGRELPRKSEDVIAEGRQEGSRKAEEAVGEEIAA